MNLPALYKKTSTGKIQYWAVEVQPMSYSAKIVTEYGQVGGKIQKTVDVIEEGKNIGRANETSPLEQAMSEAGSQWEKKLKKGYVQSFEDAKDGKIDTSVILGGADVMLAHKFAEQGHKIKFPCWVQPKLDGHRCVAIVRDGKCALWSRTRKEIFGVPHIARALEAAFPEGEYVFDGELYNHSYRDKFDELTSFIRQQTPKPGHEVVNYWIYDRIMPGTFTERFRTVPIPTVDCLVKVGTDWIKNEDELMWAVENALARGYEGLMARNVNGDYVGKRSYDLQKIKKFDDAEFEIVGVVPGRGRMSDKGVFVCATEEGAEFNCKMAGDLDTLRLYLERPDDYIGKRLTVKYQGLTNKNGVPRFPVGMRIRSDL